MPISISVTLLYWAIRAFCDACRKPFGGVETHSTRGHRKFSVCFWTSNFLLDPSDGTKLHKISLEVLNIFKDDHKTKIEETNDENSKEQETDLYSDFSHHNTG